MNEKFNVKEINLLEEKSLQIVLKKEDLVEIKLEIKRLKKLVKNSNSILFDKEKCAIRLNSLERACNRRLQHFVWNPIDFSFDLIYSLEFQSLIKNKQLPIKFPTIMISTNRGSEGISSSELSKRTFNPNLNSLGSAFIHDVVAEAINLLDGKKIYTSRDLCITEEDNNFKLEITLKKFYSLGKITGIFRQEVKNIFIKNELSTICYIKRLSSLNENGSEHYFFIKENYIHVNKIGLYIGTNLEDFDVENVNILTNSRNNLFLCIDINKYMFNREINNHIRLPSRFTQKLINKNNAHFLQKILYEKKKKLPLWSNRYSEKDIYTTPLKLSNIKNILIYIMYKISSSSRKKNLYVHLGIDEICSMGFLKCTKTAERYMFNSYLYLKLFIELYQWPDKSLEIFYICKSESTKPGIIIKKDEC